MTKRSISATCSDDTLKLDSHNRVSLTCIKCDIRTCLHRINWETRECDPCLQKRILDSTFDSNSCAFCQSPPPPPTNTSNLVSCANCKTWICSREECQFQSGPGNGCRRCDDCDFVSTTRKRAHIETDSNKNSHTTKVVKIQRKQGIVVHDCDVYIGRSCDRGGWELKESKWHNPFSIESCNGSAVEAINKYESYIRTKPHLLGSLHELKGKVLGCWCKITPTTPCHGDVLVKLITEFDLKEVESKKLLVKSESESESEFKTSSSKSSHKNESSTPIQKPKRKPKHLVYELTGAGLDFITASSTLTHPLMSTDPHIIYFLSCFTETLAQCLSQKQYKANGQRKRDNKSIFRHGDMVYDNFAVFASQAITLGFLQRLQ